MNADNNLPFKEYSSNCSQRYDSGISSMSEATSESSLTNILYMRFVAHSQLSPEDQNKENIASCHLVVFCHCHALLKNNLTHYPEDSSLKPQTVKEQMAHKVNYSETTKSCVGRFHMCNSDNLPDSSKSFSEEYELSQLKINPLHKQDQCFEEDIFQNRLPVVKDFPYGKFSGFIPGEHQPSLFCSVDKDELQAIVQENSTDRLSEVGMYVKHSVGERSVSIGSTDTSIENQKTIVASPLTEFLMKNGARRNKEQWNSNPCKPRRQSFSKIPIKTNTVSDSSKLSACGDAQILNRSILKHSGISRKCDQCDKISEPCKTKSSSSSLYIPGDIADKGYSDGFSSFTPEYKPSSEVLHVVKGKCQTNPEFHRPVAHIVDNNSKGALTTVSVNSFQKVVTERNSFRGRTIFQCTRSIDSVQDKGGTMNDAVLKSATKPVRFLPVQPVNQQNKENKLSSSDDQVESDGLMKAVSLKAASTVQLELSSDAVAIIACQQPGIHRHFSISKYPGLTAADLEDLRRRGFKHTAQFSRQPLISQNNSLDCVSDATLSKEQVEEEARAAVTRLHTILNGEKQHKLANGASSPVVLTHYPPPKEPSRITWNNTLAEVPDRLYSPNAFPTCPRPILQKRGDDKPFPCRDDPPSPIVVTRKGQFKLASSLLREQMS